MARIDRSAVKIAVLYAVLGMAWILLSDRFVLGLTPDAGMLAQLGTWKGVAFVLITAFVIYLVAGRNGEAPAGEESPMSRGVWPMVLVFVFLASAIVSVGLLGVSYHMEHHKVSMFARLQAVSDLKIGQIRVWLRERRGDAEILAHASVLSRLARWPAESVSQADRDPIVDRLAAFVQAYDYRSVFVVDTRGNALLAAGADPGAPAEPLRGALARALSEGGAQFTDIYRLQGREGPLAMDFVMTVANVPDRRLAVVLRVDPARFLFPLIQTWPVPSDTAETLLFRAEPGGVLFLNDLRHRPGSALKLRVPLSEREVLAVKQLKGETGPDGTVEGIDYRAVPVIGVAKPVPGTPWHMVAKVDKAEAYAHATGETGWIILANILMLIVAAIASVLIQQRRAMRFGQLRQREQEERIRALGLLEAIAESSTDPIFAKDTAGRYTFLNRAAARLVGREAEAILGHDDRLIFPPATADAIMARDREVIASGEVVTYESAYPLPAGDRTFLMVKGPLRGNDGGVHGVFAVARDITERKRDEEAVRASEARYRSLFGNMLNGYAYCQMIYQGDKPFDYVLLEVNPAFERQTGLKDVAGRRVTEVVPGIRESNPDIFEVYGRVAASGVAERFESYVAPLDAWFDITVYSPERGYFVTVFDAVTERKRAEAALRESEARFATVFRASPVAIGLSRLDDGRFTDVNEAFMTLFDLAGKEVVGATAAELGLWADPAEAEAVERTLRETEHCQNVELALRRAAGGSALVSGEAVELSGRRYLLWLVSDISELRAAECQARERDAILDAIFQALPDMFFLLDRDGTIRDYRAQRRTDLYVPPEVFLGRRMQDVLPPELGELFQRNLREVEENGGLATYEYDLEPPGQGRCRYEARLAKAAGDRFIAVVRDITREYRDRRALAESEERFVRALANIPDVIVIYDRDLRIRFINEASRRLTGRPVSDYLGRRDDEIWPPEVHGAYLPALGQALATGETQVREADLDLPTGRRSLLITCVPLRDASGQVAEVIGVTHDLTERKRAEDEIRQLNAELEQRVAERTAQLETANKDLATFTYSVSHDLKAPLRGIEGYSRLLLEDCGEALAGDCRKLLDNVRAGVEQMKRLIDDLLAYSRAERRELQLGPVAVADVVERVLAERAGEIGERRVEVRVELPPDRVHADPDGLLFVLRNLVDNALKFTRDARPPVIEIGGRVEGDGGSARQILWVRDNGIGFDMKFHDRIFEIFQRLNRAEDYPGTGVGLAIVAKAMQRMGGRAWAEGEPGRGATFYLELPA